MSLSKLTSLMTARRLGALSAFALAISVFVGAKGTETVAAATVPKVSAAKATPPPTALVPSSDAPTSFATLVESVKTAVVNVSVRARVRGPRMLVGPDGEWFDQFFGSRQRNGSQVRQGAGSGFIIDPKGRVLTNNHVVEGAEEIDVKLSDGRSFKAKILGRDPLTDVALLQLQNASDLPSVKLGNSDEVKVGDWLVAIGNPFGLASSVSAGILSARSRDIQAGPYDDFLQTDAAINPGNSGGPLFNMKGEVIGINTAIVGGGTGIGFAVPSNMAVSMLEQLEKGSVRRGWLGVAIQDLTPDLAKAMKIPVTEGAIVSPLERGSPAAQAGLKMDDVIVEVDGRPVDSAKSLTRTIGFRLPKSTVKLIVYRGSDRRTVPIELGERPGVSEAQPEKTDSKSESGKGKIGFSFESLKDNRGEVVLVISEVQPGTPAAEASLAPGMLIREVNGQAVKRDTDLVGQLKKTKPGDLVLFRIEMEGRKELRALKMP